MPLESMMGDYDTMVRRASPMSKNIGFTKKEAEELASCHNCDPKVEAYAQKEEYIYRDVTKEPFTHEYIVVLRKRKPK